MYDRYSCILYDSMKVPVKDAWKNPWIFRFECTVHISWSHLFFILYNVSPWRCRHRKVKTKCFSRAVWRYVNILCPILRLFKSKAMFKQHVNPMIWTWNLIDLTMASNSYAHRNLYQNSDFLICPYCSLQFEDKSVLKARFRCTRYC